jgi:2-phosphosulfolactate phosphatase
MIGMDIRFLSIADLVEAPSVAVVVDVMRAFTVAAWAFAQGAEKIVLAESLDEALALRARHPDLGGAQRRPARARVRHRQLPGPAAVH